MDTLPACSETPSGELIIEVGNVTKIFTARHALAGRAFGFFFGQEHSFLPRDWIGRRLVLYTDLGVYT